MIASNDERAKSLLEDLAKVSTGYRISKAPIRYMHSES